MFFFRDRKSGRTTKVKRLSRYTKTKDAWSQVIAATSLKCQHNEWHRFTLSIKLFSRFEAIFDLLHKWSFFLKYSYQNSSARKRLDWISTIVIFRPVSWYQETAGQYSPARIKHAPTIGNISWCLIQTLSRVLVFPHVIERERLNELGRDCANVIWGSLARQEDTI